jgi:hypothetical protein
MTKAGANGRAQLGLANKICPTVVYAESYRDFKRNLFMRFSVVSCFDTQSLPKNAFFVTPTP